MCHARIKTLLFSIISVDPHFSFVQLLENLVFVKFSRFFFACNYTIKICTTNHCGFLNGHALYDWFLFLI